MKKGFTLIELLVVISLIAILSTLVMANLNAGRERSRDVQRKSDLRNIQTALRLYYNDMGSFPASNASYQILGCGINGISICEWGVSFTRGTTVYMNVLPNDPQYDPDSASDLSYRYTQIDADTYTLEACLENKSDDKATVAARCPSGVSYLVSQQ